MEYQHIGWFNKDNHDKVWGIIVLDRNCSDEPGFKQNKYVTFWGRRGKTLQTKIWTGYYWDAEDAFEKKVLKGYNEVDKNKLKEVYPEFEQDLEKTAFWATLRA